MRKLIIAGWVGVALILGVMLWPASAGADSGEPDLKFAGDVPAATQAAVRAELRSLTAFFRDRLGFSPTGYTITVDSDAQAPSYGLGWHHLLEAIEQLAPHGSLPGNTRGPEWLFRGIDKYVGAAYSDSQGREELTAAALGETSRAVQITEPLKTLDTWERFHEVGYWEATGVGFLAVQWLVERAGERAILDYYRQLPRSGSWEQAFERAFGIAVDDFYAAFEAHRAEIALLFLHPHETDDREEPVLEFVGNVPPATQAAVRAELAKVRTFFRNRLGAPQLDYTIYVGPDAQALSDIHQRMFGRELPERFCYQTDDKAVLVVIGPDCYTTPPYDLDHRHFDAVIGRLTSSGTLPPMPDGYWHGPVWLYQAGQGYVESAYRIAQNQGEFSDDERWAISLTTAFRAAQITQPLKNLDTWERFHEAGGAGSNTASRLAMRDLVERAGERAILNYYRQLPRSDSWEQAFERAFRIAVDDFHTAFETRSPEIIISEPIPSPTLLQPGWNVTAWLGPNAPIEDLFGQIPLLRAVYAWDGDAQRFRSAFPGTPVSDLAWLATGQGLYLWLDGDAPFTWERLVATGDVWRGLKAGLNFVAWAGRDGTPIDRSFIPFDDDLARLWRWDAETSWREAQSTGTLNQGDTLWLELTADAGWWQIGVADAPVAFVGQFTEARRADVLSWTEEPRILFAERWNVAAPFMLLAGADRESLRAIYEQVRGGEMDDLCANAGGSLIVSADIDNNFCLSPRVHAHEYFHEIQGHLANGGSQPLSWMTEGAADYAASVYSALASDRAVAEQIADDVRHWEDRVRAYDLPPLREIEDYEPFHALPDGIGYQLGSLAVDWLVRHSSEMALIEYYQTIGDGVDPTEAFELAFGIALDDFYAQFETYLRTQGLR